MSVETLCDVVLDGKRTNDDFCQLLERLEKTPKECVPFKGRIIQHLRLHGLENPNIDTNLIASCHARAAVLHRPGPNRNEGPVGAWKSGLLEELLTIEDSINALYKEAGMETKKVVVRSSSSQEDETVGSYEDIINGHLLKINLAAHNICALISVDTSFELPIPVQVILKLAAKIGLLRRKDFSKKQDSLMRNFVFSLTPHLININILLFRSLITVLGTNILPSMPFINHTIFSLLSWTRTSNLSSHHDENYHNLRSLVFGFITFNLKRLSLNTNFEPQQVKLLVEDELLDNLEQLSRLMIESKRHRDKHVLESLVCLENLVMVYSDFMDAKLEARIKNYVIQKCFGIYRDLYANTINETCRRQLLQLLLVIANQPYATSCTEIAYHILELAVRLESDPETRDMARKSLRFGLAHRPTIVTPYEICQSYGSAHRPTIVTQDQADQCHNESMVDTEKARPIASGLAENESLLALPTPEIDRNQVSDDARKESLREQTGVEVSSQASEDANMKSSTISNNANEDESHLASDEAIEVDQCQTSSVSNDSPQDLGGAKKNSQLSLDQDEQVNEFLQLFVDEPPQSS